MFNDYMLTPELVDESDHLAIAEKAHDQTLAEMKEELLEAVNKRKGKVLTIALKMLNKVQEQELKTVNLSTVESLD